MKMLPENAPEEPEDWKTLLKDFNEVVMPGVSNFSCCFPTNKIKSTNYVTIWWGGNMHNSSRKKKI